MEKTLVNSSLTPEEKERKSRGDFWGGKEGAFTVYPYPDGELVYHCRLYAIGFLQPKGQTATFSNLRISEDTWEYASVQSCRDLCGERGGKAQCLVSG